MTEVLIGIGANLGERESTILAAWCELGKTHGCRTIRLSSLYETEGVGGPPNQPLYLNAVGVLHTTLSPLSLLDRLQEIETKYGRTRNERWGPRTIDLDILLFSREIIDLPRLIVPHPRMLERLFVLKPALEVAAEWIYPNTNKSLLEISIILHTGIKTILLLV
ncbi:MAG: 2-amino-4-hydroxy-6-hydroxymethyldihydropteridine diphosphokinase [Thermoguttaceae bacterium]